VAGHTFEVDITRLICNAHFELHVDSHRCTVLFSEVCSIDSDEKVGNLLTEFNVSRSFLNLNWLICK